MTDSYTHTNYCASNYPSHSDALKRAEDALENNYPVSLSQSAKIISEISGHPINRVALRNQIVRKRYPFRVYKLDREFVLMYLDVLEYAKDFNGIKIGGPKS